MAVSYINTAIAPKLVGVDTTLQNDIDMYPASRWDSLLQEARCEYNHDYFTAILKASAATAKNHSTSILIHSITISIIKRTNYSCAISIYNMINGGKHGTKNLDFQEFHLVPSTSKSFQQPLNLLCLRTVV